MRRSRSTVASYFQKLAVHTLPEKRVGELRDSVLGLEDLQDAARLAALMSKP